MKFSPPEILFSYARDENEPVESRDTLINQLYESLVQDNFTIIRDRYDAKYNDFFNDFMIELGKGKCIIVAISEKYLKSSYCMFELYEIARRSNFDRYVFREKVFPIMVEFVDFNNHAIIESYFSFWEDEYKHWRELMTKHAGRLSDEQLQQFISIKLIFQNFGRLTKWLKNINKVNPKVLSAGDFAEIKKAIFKYGAKKISLWRRRIKMPAFWIALAATIGVVVLTANWLRETQPARPATNSVIGSAGENLLIVQQLNNKRFGYAKSVDTSLYISYKYEEANPFINGIALVKLNHKYRYIHSDSTDAFSGIYDYAENFKEGKARVANGNTSFYIDNKGEIIKDTIKVGQLQNKLPGKNKDSGPVIKDTIKVINSDTCLAICDTKGIIGVEVFFRDPTNKKIYIAKSKGKNLTFKVPCYLMEQSVVVQVTFRSIDTAGYRNVKLKHFEIPEMFRTN